MKRIHVLTGVVCAALACSSACAFPAHDCVYRDDSGVENTNCDVEPITTEVPPHSGNYVEKVHVVLPSGDTYDFTDGKQWDQDDYVLKFNGEKVLLEDLGCQKQIITKDQHLLLSWFPIFSIKGNPRMYAMCNEDHEQEKLNALLGH